MLDLYSKIMLTVIAVALVVIAWNGLGTGHAVAAFGEACGTISDPCHVTTGLRDKLAVDIGAPIGGLRVSVENWPSR